MKINDHYSFPLQLDLKEWTQEYLDSRGNNNSSRSSSDSSYESAEDSSSVAPQEDGKDSITERIAAGEGEKAEGPAGSTLYECVGVLVHTGGADAGHYYSYVKAQIPAGAEGDKAGEPQGWFEFNDQNVYDFDIRTLAQNCFGGQKFQLSSFFSHSFLEYFFSFLSF